MLLLVISLVTMIPSSFLSEAQIDVLCVMFNNATDPGRLRTDAEHAACRRDAADILLAIRQRFTLGVHYRESDNDSRLYSIRLKWRAAD